MARSLTVIGAGYGSDPDKRAQFLRDTEVMARRFEELGTPEAIKPYQIGPARVQFQNKDPRAFREFCEAFARALRAGLAPTRCAACRRGGRRSTAWSASLARMKVPLHIVSGDEDDNCLEPGIFIKRVCPAARLTVVPATGHAVNVEEPDLFNRLTAEFLALVDSGRWRPRDPRSLNQSTMAKQALTRDRTRDRA